MHKWQCQRTALMYGTTYSHNFGNLKNKCTSRPKPSATSLDKGQDSLVPQVRRSTNLAADCISAVSPMGRRGLYTV